jgi:hypothetical protein
MQQQVILILIGWLTGVLSTVGYEQYKRYLDGKNLKSAILSELKVLLPRLVCSCYVLITTSGKYNKEDLQWVYDNLSMYEDKTISTKITSIKEKLEIFLKKNNISKNSTIDFKVAKSEVEFIKSITLSFSKESITNFSLLSEELRLIIFDIRTKVNTLNELADRIDFFFKQSFAPGMSSNNIEIIETNINSNYDFYLMNSKIVVERIKEIFELEKDKTV